MKNANDSAGIYSSRIFRKGLQNSEGPLNYAGTVALAAIWLLLIAIYWAW